MLQYIWIEKYNNIQELGINLTSEFQYHFDFTKSERDSQSYYNGTLSIEKVDNINIFKEGNIDDLKLLIGENGTGKTSIIKAIYTLIFSRLSSFEGILVFDNKIIHSDNIILTNKTQLSKELDILEIPLTDHTTNLYDSYLKNTAILYYTPFLDLDNIYHYEGIASEQEKFENYFLFDISTSGTIVKDYNSRFQWPYKGDVHTINPIINFKTNEQLRFVSFITDNHTLINSTIDEIKFKLNDIYSSYWQKNYNILNEEDTSERDLFADFEARNKISILDNFKESFYKEVVCFCMTIYKHHLGNSPVAVNPVVDTLNLLLPIKKDITHQGYRDILEAILRHYKEINIKTFDSIYNAFVSTTYVKNDQASISIKEKESFKHLRKLLFENQKLIIFESHYQLNIFDIEFRGLSTGEQMMIKLFSRINERMHIFNDKKYKFNKFILLLDEPENGLHPNWQVNYINQLVTTLNKLFPDLSQSIQIILTSHSPLILSDVPLHHVSFLQKDPATLSTKIIANEDQKQTWAANVYDLLNSSFFLDSTIGTYAKQRIEKILAKSSISDEDEKIINLVGDPFLKSVIQAQINSRRAENSIKDEIARLQKILDDLNRK